MTDVNHRDGASCAATYLASYAKLMWDDYQTPPHVLDLCTHLELINSGQIKRLIVCMPPRHSKSMNVAQFFPAWYLGNHPTDQVIYSSYSQGQANKFGRLVRNQLIDTRYRLAFPGCSISMDSTARNTFNTLQGGEYHAVGRGASVTGKGANLFVLDDMLKDHVEAASSTIRRNVVEWYQAVASTRLQSGAAVVLCGTRWHEDDLIGWVLKNTADQDWTVLNFPAIDDSGSVLWPEMFSRATLEKIKKTIGTYFWNALYMQRPSALEGNIWKRKAWRFWRELPRSFDIMIQSWDATFKETNEGSFVVGQVWGMKGADFFLIDQVRKRIGFTDTIKEIIILSEKYQAARIKLIEDKANGPAIMDVLKTRIPGIVSYPEKGREMGSKTARAEAVAPLQEEGRIYIPDPAIYSWVNGFIDRFASFPKVDHDDEIDATSQALDYFTNRRGGVTRLQKLLADL